MSMWLPIWPNKRTEMNELALANRAADWRRLKALVLDSVSSPITERAYNLGLDEFFAWYGRGPARLHQGDGERLARGVGGPRPGVGLHQRPHHGGAEVGGRGGRQRAAGTGTRRPREGRQVRWRAGRELVVRPAGAETDRK